MGSGRPDAHGGHALGQPPNTYGGPVSNDPLTIRFKQTIDASGPLRTGALQQDVHVVDDSAVKEDRP